MSRIVKVHLRPSSRLKTIIIDIPNVSIVIILIILALLPFLFLTFPLSQNYPFLLYLSFLFISIFLTTIAALLLPIFILKHRYENAFNSLKNDGTANLSPNYVLGIYGLLTLLLLPLLFVLIMIFDIFSGGIGFFLGLIAGFLSSILYLEKHFLKLQKQGSILFISIFKYVLILTDKKLPKLFRFKIHGKNFEKIKKDWTWILWFFIFIPLQQLTIFIPTDLREISGNIFINPSYNPIKLFNFYAFIVYIILYTLIYLLVFIIPFKKVKNIDWIIAELHSHYENVKEKFK